ncbi:HNH endonuclease [Pseudomonas svalbardensis]|uniref:HNH endonuclease n=1 Tax=Pseudomonas svalbardensis TaxID=3042029 RepID=UPI0024B3A7E0|nr:HNH endonuclease [Pseudomonas sp. PMCC200367]
MMTNTTMSVEERLDYFVNNYDLIAAGVYSKGPEKIIKTDAIKKCRFCKKNESETNFTNTAHAIPECLGNHQLVLSEECDSCNKFFSENLEVHLDKYTRPFRVMGQIHGKRGVPNYQSNNQKSKVKHGEIPAFVSPATEKFFTIDKENKTATVNFHREPYIPLGVYKALVKIALSTIENKEELSAFSETIGWLMCADQTKSVIKPAVVIETFIPGPRPTCGVAVSLFRRKPSCASKPYAIFMIAFGNIAMQLIVPSILDRTTLTTRCIAFPTPFELCGWPFGQPRTYNKDMSGTEKRKEDYLIEYSFDDIEAIPPDSIDPELYSK